MAQRNFLINTTTISTTASGTTIASGNTQSATFVVALTLVRSGISAAEFASGSQTWAVHYVVSAMTTPYEMRLKVQRRNSGGTMQAESGYTTVRTATGTYDDNLTADLGVWAANDQLALVWEHRRPSGTGNKNATIDANGSSFIDAPTPPLDLPKTVSDDVNNLADAKGLGYGNLHTDSVNNLADTISLVLGHALPLSDSVDNLADGEVRVVGGIITAQDSLQALADTLAQLLSYQLALADSEAANWADSHNLLLSQFLALADSNLPADAAVWNLEQREDFTDSFTLSDAAEVILDLPVSLTDSLPSFDDSLAIGHGLLFADSINPAPGARPSILFLDPGGDAAGAIDYFNTITTTGPGTPPTYDTSQQAVGVGSYRFETTVSGWQSYADTGNVLGTQGHCRISFKFRYDSVPDSITTIFEGLDIDHLNLFQITISPQGDGVVVVMRDESATTYSGSIELLPNTWNRISFSYIEHALDDTDIKVYVNGIEEISVAALPSGDTSPPLPFLRYGWISNPGVNRVCWFDQIYVDAGDDLSDAGDVLLTAKLPASVNEDNWDTTGGTGAVDERPLDEANFKQHTASSSVRQTYTLQDAATGDVDISGASVIGCMGWAWAKRGAGDDGDPALIVNNTAQPIILTPTPKLFRFSITSSSYPSHAAGIGMRSNEENADSFLYECGVVVATVTASGFADALAYDLVTIQPPEITLGLSDTLSALTDSLAIGYGLLPTDTLDPLLDALTMQSDGSLEATDTIVLSDTESHTLEFQLAFAETISLTDSLELGYGVTFSDTLTFTDQVALQLDQLESLTDTLVLTDGESHVLGYNEALSDDVNLLADSITLQLGHEIAIADTLVLSDSHALELGQQLTFTDSIVLTDSYAHDLINTVEGTTEEFADDVNLLTDSLALGIGLVFSDNADNLTDAEVNTVGHSLNLTDSVILSDSIALELQYLLTLDDSFSLTDAQSSVLGYRVSFADSIDNLSDAVDIQLGLLISLSDSVDNLADSHTETIAHLLSFSDALTLTDSITLGYGLVVSEDVSFLIDAIETSAPQGPLREVGLTDAIDLSDAIALELGYLLEVSDDAATLNDSSSLIEGLLTSFSDSISLTDNVAATLDHLSPLADSFTLSDATQIQLGYGLDLSDVVSLNDSISLRLGHELAADDSFILSDAIDLAEGYFVAFSDSFTLTDEETARLDYLTALADSLVLSDTVQLRLDHLLNLSDVVALTDSFGAGASLNLNLADNAALLTDSEAQTLGLALILADNGPVFAESIEFFSAWQLRFSDTLTLIDSLAKFSAGFLPLEDTLTITDSAVIELRGPDLDESVSDSLVLTDSIALSLGDELQLQVVLSDVFVLADHYFDLRLPYIPNLKRNSVVPSRARLTTISSERLVIVPASNRTTKIS